MSFQENVLQVKPYVTTEERITVWSSDNDNEKKIRKTIAQVKHQLGFIHNQSPISIQNDQ